MLLNHHLEASLILGTGKPIKDSSRAVPKRAPAACKTFRMKSIRVAILGWPNAWGPDPFALLVRLKGQVQLIA